MSRYALFSLAASMLTLAGSVFLAPVAHAQPPPVPYDPPDAKGGVSWNHDKTGNPVKEAIPPMGTLPGSLDFYWTTGFDSATQEFIPANYQRYKEDNTSKNYVTRFFYPPNDPAIKDWAQQVTDGEGHESDVRSGAIKHDSPWAFFSLSDLPNLGYEIPDFAAIADSSITIYEAVNLPLYMTSNPGGLSGGNYAVGQTLDDLGVTIVNGQVAGVQGIYFSLSPFTFDPNSLTGYVPSGGDSTLLNSSSFEAQHGALGIIGIHQQVPEPGGIALLFAGSVSAVMFLCRRSRAEKYCPE